MHVPRRTSHRDGSAVLLFTFELEFAALLRLSPGQPHVFGFFNDGEEMHVIHPAERLRLSF